MKIVLYVVFTIILFVTGYSIVYWTTKPQQSHDSKNKQCADCHQQSIMQDHTVEFIKHDHAFAAVKNRENCLKCHQEKMCADCHNNEMPSWHNNPFCKPGLNYRNRDIHIQIASKHGTCMECHATRFQTQCSKCHVPGALE